MGHRIEDVVGFGADIVFWLIIIILVIVGIFEFFHVGIIIPPSPQALQRSAVLLTAYLVLFDRSPSIRSSWKRKT